jgi:glycerol-3-phosphate acyltransferase PlsX
MEHVQGISRPRVAIVNIGSEEAKGNRLVQDTYPLLKECGSINFIGSIESREIPYGGADVIVCEAFVGNVILKLYEGLATALIGIVKDGMKTSLRGKVGGLLAKPALKQALAPLDASQYGGAPMLGLSSLVVKTHGNSKAVEISNAIMQCVAFVKGDVTGKMRETFGNRD